MNTGVPKMPLDEMIVRISEIKEQAAARGFPFLAYLLDMALFEALTQQELEADGRSEASLAAPRHEIRGALEKSQERPASCHPTWGHQGIAIAGGLLAFAAITGSLLDWW